MTKKERAKLLVEGLKKEYPDAVCSLVACNPFELLVATRLSAQCTDARVNLVTPALFNKYRTLDDYVNADVKDIENIIHSCGFYHGKARDIIEMARGVRDRFGGVVPDNIEDLTMSGIIQDDTLVINAYIPHYKGNLKILVKNIDNKLIIYPFNISPHEWTHSETNKTYCFEAKIKLLNINNIKSIVFSDWESFLYDDYPNKEFPIIKN